MSRPIKDIQRDLADTASLDITLSTEYTRRRLFILLTDLAEKVAEIEGTAKRAANEASCLANGIKPD